MAYSEQLADRIRSRFEHFENVEEKAMMGGLVYMYNGKMCVGIIKDELMCRINPSMHEELLEREGCRTMDFTNRPMKGYILISPEAIVHQKDFDYWINLALEFNTDAKASKKKKK
jgi:TfoX/Sxy family transcriptional regulator of competence genes